MLLLVTKGHAQFGIQGFHLMGTVENVAISQLPAYTTFGIRGELLIGNSFGSEFGFSGSRDNFHVGLGILSPLALLLAGSGNDDEERSGSLAELVLFAACAVSFIEHTNYHIRITDGFEIVPFLSLARFRYMYDRTDPFYNTDQFMSWSVGTKVTFLTKENFLLNLSGERTQLYHTGRPAGFQAGIHIGYRFGGIAGVF
jgi:hypothetical protein